MSDTPLRSPLVSAFNNIVKINRSRAQMGRTKNSLDDFLRFMNVETKNLEAIKLPDQKQINKITTTNVSSTFGRPGSLLSALASGAMDVASFVGDFFRGRRGQKGGAIPKGKGIRLSGLKAVGIANAAFAGLDFATGLAEGESVGKAAAGAGGALAGSLLGGAIGQALIPVPGLGFVVGSMAGNFLGGFLGDRAHEAITGEGVKEKQEQKLAENEAKQKASAAVQGNTFTDITNKFDDVVFEFEKYAYTSIAGSANAIASVTGQEPNQEFGAQYPDKQGGGKPYGDGKLQKISASGGKAPSSVTKTSGFGPRWGRNHNGNDYAGSGVDNEPISVIQEGKVGYAGYLGSAGNAVVIDHPDGSTTKYFHLADGSITVSKGQDIVPGQVIGVVGNTGRSTGTHLHFELWKNGRAVDPSSEADNYFRFGGDVTVTQSADAEAAPGQTSVPGSTEETEGTVRTPSTITPPTEPVRPDRSNFATGRSGAKAYENAMEKYNADVKKYNEQQQEPPTVDPNPNATITPPTEPVRPDRSKFTGRSGAAAFEKAIEKYNAEMEEYKVKVEEYQSMPVAAKVSPTQAAAARTSLSQGLEQYPSYNTQQSQVMVIPISQDPVVLGGGQRPMVINSGGGGGGTIVMPPPNPSVVLNSLFKTALLTTLSST